MHALEFFVFASLVSLAGCATSTGTDEAEVGNHLEAQTTAAANAEDPITLRNWVSHPKIVEVRNLVHQIDASRLKRAHRDELCDGIGEISREIGTDADGKVRKLVRSSGSDDSAGTETYYYDAAGKLRFAFETGGDVHGGGFDKRVYFDAAGRAIWSVNRSARNPSLSGDPDLTKAPFTTPTTEDRLDIPAAVQTDPKGAFAGPPVCG